MELSLSNFGILFHKQWLQLMRLSFCLVILFAFTTTDNTLSAQKVRFSISSEKITTDEAVEVTMELSEVSGSVPYPKWPEVKGLAAGGTSTHQSSFNGRMSVAFSRTYFPKSTGNFTIPSFTYAVAGKSFQSPDFKVSVKKGSGKPKQQQQQSMNPFDAFFGDPFSQRPKDELKFQETKADYFLSINLDKDSCYVGEQVRGDVVLYINERDYGKINLDGRDIVDMQQQIKNNGFWQEIIEFEQVPMNRVVINGKRYIAYTLYQTILFPIRSGKIEFKGITLNAKKLYVATNASIMDAFMGTNQKYEPITIKANERKLNVRPLPETNLPQANMVGKFKLSAKLSDSVASTGDNLELLVKVTGNGNMAMMELPTPSFPPYFRNDGNSNDFVSRVAENGFSGDKTFKFFLVPTKPGKFDLGPIKFYFFDNQRRKYDSLVVASMPISVTGEDLTDKLLREKGLDSFYDKNFSEAGSKLRSDQGAVWPFWAAGMMAVAGTVVFRVVAGLRRRKETRED